MTRHATFRSACLLLSVALPATAPAQARPATTERPVLTVTGAAFALSVADIESSTRWYVEKLGLKVIMQLPRTDATRARVTVLQGGGLTVELVQHDDALPSPPNRPGGAGATSVHGIFKVGVVVDDFDAALAALRSNGVEIAFGPFARRPDQAANVMVRDNAGNLIQIFGPR